MSRTPISPRLRFEVLLRDEFTCQYCGAKAPAVQLEVDHIRPVSASGGGERSNLVTACATCNRGKSDALAICQHVQQVSMVEAALAAFPGRLTPGHRVRAFSTLLRLVKIQESAAPPWSSDWASDAAAASSGEQLADYLEDILRHWSDTPGPDQ